MGIDTKVQEPSWAANVGWWWMMWLPKLGFTHSISSANLHVYLTQVFDFLTDKTDHIFLAYKRITPSQPRFASGFSSPIQQIFPPWIWSHKYRSHKPTETSFWGYLEGPGVRTHTYIYIYIYVCVCVWHCMYVCIWYHINSHLDPHVSLVKQRFVPCEIINTGPLFCSRRVTARSAGCQRSARVTPWMTWDVGMFQHHHVHQEQKCTLEIYPPSNHQIDFGGEKGPKFTNSKFTNLWCWIRNDWSQFSMALRIETPGCFTSGHKNFLQIFQPKLGFFATCQPIHNPTPPSTSATGSLANKLTTYPHCKSQLSQSHPEKSVFFLWQTTSQFRACRFVTLQSP